MRSSPQHVVSFTLEVMSTAKKRSVSRRDVAGPSEDAEDLIIDPSAAIESDDSGSESEKSSYSGLESEPDTDEEEEDLGLISGEESGSEPGLASESEPGLESESEPELESGSEPELESGSEVIDSGSRRDSDSNAEDEKSGANHHEKKEIGPRKGEGLSKSWKEAEDTDTSDEEEVRNTVGNVPLEWYEDYPHIGYDQDGRPVLKPAKGDELDEFLAKMDDPNYWRTVRDQATGKSVTLTDRELDMIQKIQQSEFPEPSYDPYEPYIDFFTHEKMIHPLSSGPEPKSRFIPSKWEHQKIGKLVHAIKMGWIKPQKRPERPKFYMIWSDTDKAEPPRHRMHIPAPKMKLPGHAESYNPPPEYLPTEEEIQEWNDMEPEDRTTNFLPQKYNSLREVPAYPNFIQERFERCLDLYLCPRQRRMRVKVDPEDLIPKLPKPKDLHPFPTTEAIVYEGHASLVRCVSVEPLGQWLVSGSDDETLRLWEVATGRCMGVVTLPGKPLSLAFCPNSSLTLVAAAVDSSVFLINHGLGDRLLVSATDSALSTLEDSEAASSSSPPPVTWQLSAGEDHTRGFRVCLLHTKTVKQVVWHAKGDYFATLLSDAAGSAVFIHQLSKRRSQNPFRKLKGAVQKVMFHPSRPFFFVATQTYIKVYNLVKQELTKKLQSGVKWISSMDIHPHGDNLIIGSYDKRLCWFDMDLSNKPYRIIRHHKQAIRQVCFHPRYPLFASCCDGASVIVCHGMVYNDLMQNPLIVPVKLLKGHKIINNLGVTDCQFHPIQPWIFTAGADSTLRLYT